MDQVVCLDLHHNKVKAWRHCTSLCTYQLSFPVAYSVTLSILFSELFVTVFFWVSIGLTLMINNIEIIVEITLWAVRIMWQNVYLYHKVTHLLGTSGIYWCFSTTLSSTSRSLTTFLSCSAFSEIYFLVNACLIFCIKPGSLNLNRTKDDINTFAYWQLLLENNLNRKMLLS